MGGRQRRRGLGWLVMVLAVAGVSGLVWSAGPARSTTTRTVTFHGYRVQVPASWAVVDLGRHPSACVRFDVHAVYLGHPGPAQSCPSRLVGRTESLLVEPLDKTSRARATTDLVWVTGATAAVRTLPARAGHEVRFAVSNAGVLVTASYGSDPAALTDVLQSATLTADAQPAADQPPATADAPLVSASVVAPGTLTGKGFDACTAPSATAMQAWLASSAYRAVGVYIGGASRACSQPNLTASWVSTQTAQGWHLVPIYVGLQAPCTGFNQRIDPANAAAQGQTAADDAVVQAGLLGIGGGSTVYADMEAYSTTDTACRDAVLTFLSAWSSRLHALGYKSGAYSSVGSGIRDLVAVYSSTAYTRPDHIWFARWDGGATVSDPAIPDADWPDHHRIKQYQGGHDESYGGVTINIDNDYLDVTSEEPPPPPPVTDGDQDAPAVVNLGSEIHVFARGADQGLYETFYRPGSGWSTWTAHPGVTIAGTPAAVPYGTGINLFARGTDQRLYESYYRPGSGWSRWAVHVGATLAGDPAVVLYGTGFNVFALGSDQRLYETYYRTTSRWSGWRAHGGAALAGDPPALKLGTEIHLFARGTDGGLYDSFYRPGFGWSAWTPHAGATLAGDPAAVPYGTGFNVFARGTDQLLHETYFRPSSGWSRWAAHAGAGLAGDPAPVAYGTEIHVFERGSDDVMRETLYRPGSGWLAWTAHPGVTIAGRPAAETYNTDIHVFARANGHLYETYYRPGPGWSAWGLRGGTAVAIA
ncbi:MAG TPA: glycoside hydrolase domain-containing protein [Actinomycetes bacterium]|nr:glycoside hydrolase domain-containing protein [Actinomycetes bacterium]